MVEFYCKRITPQSFSHWGLFDYASERVKCRYMDLGYNAGAYEGVFLIDNVEVLSLIPAYKAQNVADRYELESSILREHGLDPDTREFIE